MSNNDIGLGNCVDKDAASSNPLQAGPGFRRSPIAWDPHNVYNYNGLYLLAWGYGNLQCHIIMNLILDLSSDAPGPAFTVLSTFTPTSSPCLPSLQNKVCFLKNEN